VICKGGEEMRAPKVTSTIKNDIINFNLTYIILNSYKHYQL